MDEIATVNLTNKSIVKDSFFNDIFKAVKSHLNEKRQCVLSIILADIKLSKKISKIYKQKEGPSDILTFIYKSDRKSINGEVVLCLKLIKKKDLAKYFIHGLLHYFGFHHNNQRSYLKMNRLEEEILAKNLAIMNYCDDND